MSTKCAFRVNGNFKSRDKNPDGTEKIIHKLRPCGKDPEVFLEVHYSELGWHHRKSGKYTDVFGCCASHGELLQTNVNLWGGGDWSTRKMNGVRGTVKFVRKLEPSEIPDPKEMARREDKLRLMSGVKSSIKRLMGQGNTKKLSPDDWRTIFDESMDEFIVESVMES